MGTRIELHLFGAAGADALAEARRTIEAVDDALTIHRPSATTRLNACLRAGRSAAVDDPLLFDALIEIQMAHALTEGMFDPGVQSEGGWRAITFDPKRAKVETSRPVALDFGGFGKGFALDRACAALRLASVGSAFLSAGESSVSVIGTHPLGGAWPVAIPHPLDSGQVLAEIELENEALSISATVGAGVETATRAAMIRPNDGAIILSPRTAVAVEASGARAEAMSTALVVATDAIAQRLIDTAGKRRRFLFTHTGEALPSSANAGMTIQ